jgi:1-acyl-sn-glycerol-3-phosphate acyltransferase
MIFRNQGTLLWRVVQAIISITLRLFFRRIESSGVENVPLNEGIIFVLNHPNGLIDPGLVFVSLPRRVSFLAKSTLFKLPVVGFALRTLEALPLYRRVDASEGIDPAINAALNQRTFEACYTLLQQNRCIALFPEGVSHNSTQLLPLKTGAARIALGALSFKSSDERAMQSLKIVPVGLYYTSKTNFRSEALLRYGAPFEVFPVELDETGQPPREAVRELSERIAVELKQVTLNVENDRTLETVKRIEQLFSSVSETINLRQTLSDELDLRRTLAARLEQIRANNPQRAEVLDKRIADYEEKLGDLNIAPEHLSVAEHSSWQVFRYFLLRLAVIAVLLPLIIVGATIHFPAYLICLLLARIFRRHGVDDAGGSIKIMAAMFLMPMTWMIAAVILFFQTNWQIALASIPVSIICGYTALRCLEELVAMSGWFNAVFFLARHPQLFIRLQLERRTLHREIAALVPQKTSRR